MDETRCISTNAYGDQSAHAAFNVDDLPSELERLNLLLRAVEVVVDYADDAQRCAIRALCETISRQAAAIEAEISRLMRPPLA